VLVETATLVDFAEVDEVVTREEEEDRVVVVGLALDMLVAVPKRKTTHISPHRPV